MAWDDLAPSQNELSATSAHAWDAEPPSKDELSKSVGDEKSWLDTKIPGGTPRGFIQGALNTLPAVGMVGGGVIGSGTPVTPVGGAALGAAGGEALKNLGEKYILDKEKTRADIYGGPIKAAIGGASAEMGGQAVGKGLELASETAPAKYVSEKVGDFGKWLATNASNVPKADIETYLKDPTKVMSLFKEAGGDEQELADSARKSINEKIQSTKAGLNNQISQTLANRSTQTIESKPIIDQLESAKAKINSKLRPDEIKEVDDLVEKVKSVSSEGGQIPLQDAHDLKEYLRDQAKGSYSKNGQMFSVGDKTAKAAKAGAATARSMIDEAAPEIAAANSKLSELHDIDEVMGRNVLAEGKSANSFFSAANGESGSNSKALRQLGEITGEDVIGDAKLASAARTFGNPSMTPLDKTGKSVARMGAAAVLGGGAGYLAGDEKGAIAGAMLAEGITSPAAIKLAMDSGIGLKGLAKISTSAAPSVVGKTVEKIAPTSLIDKTLKVAGLKDSSEPTPKGPAKWQADGFQKLIEHTGGTKDLDVLTKNKSSMLADPKTKDLLAQASDLKPGSKAMNDILTKIKARIAMGGN